MPWRQQSGGGGGPWGGGGGSGGGGSGGGGGPWGRGPGGPTPPDFEDLFRKGQDRFRRMMPGGLGSGRGVLIIIAVLFGLWILSGFYRVQPDEKGIVLRFGQFVRVADSGLRYHLPTPIETVIKPKVTRVNRIEVGLRTQTEGARGPAVRDVPEESLMLTGDENIVDIDFSVFWFINKPEDFLFNIHNPEQTVKVAAESVMREVIGKTRIQSALTEGRSEIERGVQSRLQQLLDGYHAGVQVQQVQLLKVDPPQPVIDAFIDVQRARADQERARNEAEAYSRDVVPRARGDSQRLIQEATAYREEVVNRAQGEAQRFLSVYEAYRLAKDVTMQRIYLETMEEVMRDMTKIIIDPGAQGSQGVLPYLPLPELRQRAPQAPRQGPQTSGPPIVQGQTPAPPPAQPQPQPQPRSR